MKRGDEIKIQKEITGKRVRYILTDEILRYIQIQLDENVSMSAIAKEIDCGHEKLRKIVLERWPDKIKRNHHRVSRDSRYFSVIDTPEKAYWLGLLYADGSVRYGRENRLPSFALRLQENDRYLLEQLKSDLNYGGSLQRHLSSIRNRSHVSYELSIRDQQIFDDLLRAGMKIGKTNRVFPTEDQVPSHLIWHFLRGLLDGDGCIPKRTLPTRIDYGICFTGPYAIVSGVSNFLGMRHLAFSHVGAPGVDCYTLPIGGNLQIHPVLEKLYANPTRKLERKYQRFLEYKDYYNTYCRAS